MSSSPSLLLVLLLPLSLMAEPGHYGYGKPASAEEIAGWDIDVRPDGKGLPPGSGSVADGEWLYEEQCAECHGSFGEGVGRYPALAGGEGTLTDMRPHKTVGSFWPYTSTLWDYIHRAMPFTRPESLSDDEVYALTAYVLYLNDIVDDEFVLDQDNLASIELPNSSSFRRDDRPDTHNTRCMSDCRDPALIEIASIVEPKIQEAESAPPVTGTNGGEVYGQACGLCHNSGLGGAPVLGDAKDWTERVARGREQLVRHAIDGFEGEAGMMPPKGGFVHLSDEDVEAAVNYMLEQGE